MDIDNDTPVPSLDHQAASEGQPQSLLEQLAAKRREISQNKEVHIPIPGYDAEPPVLLAKYRLMEGKELDIIGRRASQRIKGAGNNWDRLQSATVDTLVEACVGFYYDMGDGDYKQLRSANGEPITGYTRGLAEAMSFLDELPEHNRENPKGSQICFALFAYRDTAISQHHYLLSRWFADTSFDVNRGLLGNL